MHKTWVKQKYEEEESGNAPGIRQNSMLNVKCGEVNPFLSVKGRCRRWMRWLGQEELFTPRPTMGLLKFDEEPS